MTLLRQKHAQFVDIVFVQPQLFFVTYGLRTFIFQKHSRILEKNKFLLKKLSEKSSEERKIDLIFSANKEHNFKMFRIFPVDNQLVFSLFTIILSYCIMLIQFEIESN